MNWVLANTLQEKSHDGRFSQENKKWAKGFFIPSDDVRWHFCVESHPGLTDLFINQAREAWQKLGLFDQSHRSEDNDYAGKLLILKPSVLKDEYKASDYQLFYAESGFGAVRQPPVERSSASSSRTERIPTLTGVTFLA